MENRAPADVATPGPEAQPRFGHGAEPLLSISQALRGDFVGDGAEAHNVSGPMLLGLPVRDFGVLDFEGLPIDAPAEFDQVPRDAIHAAWPLASVELGQEIAAALVDAAARFAVHFSKV